MAIVALDVDFMLRHTNECGLDLVKSAIEHDPKFLHQLLSAGWGRLVVAEEPRVSRNFLSHLIKSAAPGDARMALRTYFSGVAASDVTEHVVNSSAKSGEYSPLLNWLLIRYGHCPPKDGVIQALLEESQSLGANLELVFTHSLRESAKDTSSNHTILSALVGNNSLNFLSRKDDVQVAADMVAVSQLLEVGKKFDKNTAAVLVRMPSGNAKVWLDYFLEKKIVNASELLKMTSRMKFEPETKAMLSSLAAAEAIESVFLPKSSP